MPPPNGATQERSRTVAMRLQGSPHRDVGQQLCQNRSATMCAARASVASSGAVSGRRRIADNMREPSIARFGLNSHLKP
jgi:hypothetical protein